MENVATVEGIDEELYQKVASEIAEAIRKVAKANGLRYLERRSKATIDTMSIAGELEGVRHGVPTSFIKAAFGMGISPDHYGDIVEQNGKKFQIIGLNPRAKKYVLETKAVSNGERYDLPLGVCIARSFVPSAWY